MGRHGQFRHESLETFRRATAQRVEALNHALAGIPEAQIQYHICWATTRATQRMTCRWPTVVDLLLAVRACALLCGGRKPAPRHEWQVWEQVTLPDDKILIPGLIDSTTTSWSTRSGGPRIEQYARIVGGSA